MENETCDDETGNGVLQREIRISKNQYIFKERRLSPDGQIINVINDYTSRNMKRARWFACMIDVPKDTPNRSNRTQHYIKLHDQGDEFYFIHPDDRDMKLIMRNT